MSDEVLSPLVPVIVNEYIYSSASRPAGIVNTGKFTARSFNNNSPSAAIQFSHVQEYCISPSSRSGSLESSADITRSCDVLI